MFIQQGNSFAYIIESPEVEEASRLVDPVTQRYEDSGSVQAPPNTVARDIGLLGSIRLTLHTPLELVVKFLPNT